MFVSHSISLSNTHTQTHTSCRHANHWHAQTQQNKIPDKIIEVVGNKTLNLPTLSFLTKHLPLLDKVGATETSAVSQCIMCIYITVHIAAKQRKYIKKAQSSHYV